MYIRIQKVKLRENLEEYGSLNSNSFACPPPASSLSQPYLELLLPLEMFI